MKISIFAYEKSFYLPKVSTLGQVFTIISLKEPSGVSGAPAFYY
jgi:hypothetical protein